MSKRDGRGRIERKQYVHYKNDDKKYSKIQTTIDCEKKTIK